MLSLLLPVLLVAAPAPSSSQPSDPERVANFLWPRRAPEVQYPAVRAGPNGKPRVETLRLRDATRSAVRAAERAVVAGRWAEAEAIYARVEPSGEDDRAPSDRPPPPLQPGEDPERADAVRRYVKRYVLVRP